jgi:hypothetical protein
MDISMIRIICGVIGVVLLALIILRRKAKQTEED